MSEDSQALLRCAVLGENGLKDALGLMVKKTRWDDLGMEELSLEFCKKL